MSERHFNPFRDRTVLLSGAMCVLGFGGFAAWAGLAPLDEGVMARGAVVIEDRGQLVQHLAGGVITNLAVNDADPNAQLKTRRQAPGAAEDVLAGTVKNAPANGEMVNVSVGTVGGVPRPGKTTVAIASDRGGLTAAIQIAPDERAWIRIGQSVRAQLISHRAWQTPPLAGRVTGLSEDLKVDPETNAKYYEARILIPDDETAKLGTAGSLPGMPVQAFIFSGVRRTLFEQIAEPILERWPRGMRKSP